MFCVKEHQFNIDPEGIFFSASLHPDADTGATRMSWDLEIRAIPRTIAIPAAGDDSPVELAPRISFRPQFTVTDWRALARTRHTFPEGIDGLWLLKSEWEPCTYLKIVFGAIHDRSLAVELTGIGLHDYWPELLGSEIPFSINTSITFSGVTLRTEPNVANPAAHATSRIRHYLPDYSFDSPRVEEIRHDGSFYGCYVIFPPAPSA